MSKEFDAFDFVKRYARDNATTYRLTLNRALQKAGAGARNPAELHDATILMASEVAFQFALEGAAAMLEAYKRELSGDLPQG